MTSTHMAQSGAGAPQSYGTGLGNASREPANLGDILERVLDKGIVIAGDIRVNLLDIELLTIKLRLVIASLDTARQVGLNWWETDPWLSSGAPNGSSGRELADENRRLRHRVEQLESGRDNGAGPAEDDFAEPRSTSRVEGRGRDRT
jgi:gas vesicle protein GvpA/GvpJ/GvpM family